jgi:hypothetical protein
MKKILYSIVFSIICSSCSSSPSGSEDADSIPSVPVLVFPAQDQLCITNTLDFKWNASTNSDGSSVIYTFEIAKDNQFSDIVVTETQTSLSKIVTLEKGFAYYWRAKARSSKNIESDYSPTSQFYTEEVPNSNNLPFSPALVAPFIGQTFDGTNSISLQWTASDVDKDPLKFDVYFGKDKDALTVVAQDTENTSLQVTLDTAQTTYYWKVIVKDDKGAQVTGPLWSFKADNL